MFSNLLKPKPDYAFIFFCLFVTYFLSYLLIYYISLVHTNVKLCSVHFLMLRICGGKHNTCTFHGFTPFISTVSPQTCNCYAQFRYIAYLRLLVKKINIGYRQVQQLQCPLLFLLQHQNSKPLLFVIFKSSCIL